MHRYDNEGSQATETEIRSRYSQAAPERRPGADISGAAWQRPLHTPAHSQMGMRRSGGDKERGYNTCNRITGCSGLSRCDQ